LLIRGALMLSSVLCSAMLFPKNPMFRVDYFSVSPGSL
jgi:hypothetical protein